MTEEPWPGFNAMKSAFENAPACHHDHSLPDRLARELVTETDQWLAGLRQERIEVRDGL